MNIVVPFNRYLRKATSPQRARKNTLSVQLPWQSFNLLPFLEARCLNLLLTIAIPVPDHKKETNVIRHIIQFKRSLADAFEKCLTEIARPNVHTSTKNAQT